MKTEMLCIFPLSAYIFLLKIHTYLLFHSIYPFKIFQQKMAQVEASLAEHGNISVPQTDEQTKDNPVVQPS